MSFVDETDIVASNYLVLSNGRTCDVESLYSTEGQDDVQWIESVSDTNAAPPSDTRILPYSHARQQLDFLPDDEAADYDPSPISNNIQHYNSQSSPVVVSSSLFEQGVPLSLNASFSNIKEAYLLRHYSETVAPCVGLFECTMSLTY